MNRPFRVAAALTFMAAGAGVTGCAFRSHARVAPGAEEGEGTPPPPIVQVREFPRSSTITVLSWDADEISFGLTGRLVRETGELSGDRRLGDHRLYVSTTYVSDQGGYDHAVVAPGLILRSTGAQREPDPCYRTRNCAPMEFVAVALPDSVLRANRDSLVVNFTGGAQPKGWSIVLNRELISAYLSAVDSVRATLRKG